MVHTIAAEFGDGGESEAAAQVRLEVEGRSGSPTEAPSTGEVVEEAVDEPGTLPVGHTAIDEDTFGVGVAAQLAKVVPQTEGSEQLGAVLPLQHGKGAKLQGVVVGDEELEAGDAVLLVLTAAAEDQTGAAVDFNVIAGVVAPGVELEAVGQVVAAIELGSAMGVGEGKLGAVVPLET